MNAADFVRARSRLGLTGGQLALELDLTPQIVAALEGGSVPVPEETAKELLWRVALLERQEALTASGLPECPWIQTWNALPMPTRSGKLLKHIESLTVHTAECSICQSREQFAQDRFGPMPERPIPGWQGMVGSVIERVERLPRIIQPAAKGALLFVAMTGVRVLFMLPGQADSWRAWMAAIEALALSAALGAVLGGLFGAAQRARQASRRKHSKPQ